MKGDARRHYIGPLRKGAVRGSTRDLSRKRLTRRGLALSAGMLVGLFGAGTAPAAVPGALQAAIVQAAAAFAAGKPP